MSKRAEEAALKAYPPKMNNPIDYWYQKYLKEKQTKKDLALTWEDIEEILIIDAELMEEAYVNKKLVLMQSHYKEILKRFNEYKSKKNESK